MNKDEQIEIAKKIRTAKIKAQAAQIIALEFLQFQVQILPETALVWAKESQGYNQHTTENLVSIIEGCNKLIPPMKYGKGNPNDGQPHHVFAVGNEYSRVIYLKVIKTYLPAGFDYSGLTKALTALGERNNAQERSVQKNDGTCYEFRFWFD